MRCQHAIVLCVCLFRHCSTPFEVFRLYTEVEIIYCFVCFVSTMFMFFQDLLYVQFDFEIVALNRSFIINPE